MSDEEIENSVDLKKLEKLLPPKEGYEYKMNKQGKYR